MSPAAHDNVILIGMPGAGKSTLGVLLAKTTARDFVDTDVLLQTRAGRPLQTILDSAGVDAFRRLEEETLLSLDCRRTVVATGGSAVYSEAGMQHLAAGGTVVFLDVPLSTLRQRLGDLPERGVVGLAGNDLNALLAERRPLYERYADVRIACDDAAHGETLGRILSALPR